MLRVLTNWGPEKLVSELRKYGIAVSVIRTRRFHEFLSVLSNRNHDIGYFARFSPPLIDVVLSGNCSSGKPVIYALHSPLLIDRPCRPSHFLHNVLFSSQGVHVRKHVFAFHALNRDDLKLLKVLRLPAVYLPLGVDTELFRPCEKESEFTLIYASRASWHKGTDILVNYVVPYIANKFREVKIRIISYGFLEHLYSKVREFPNVEVVPFLPRKDFVKVLAQSHVLLFPSRFESYGLVVLEALSSGVVPVAFNVRGFVRDVLAKHRVLGKYVVRHSDIGAFIRCIVELYTLFRRDPDFFNEHLIKEARQLAVKYSWENLAKLYAYVFTRIYEAYVGR